jgi:secondary thiamine-phosphate synthase enzyme
MQTQLLEIRTGARFATDITKEVAEFCRSLGDGLCNVFVPHATAGVALIETGSGTEADLEMIMEAVLPREAGYRHRHGSPGHGRDHVLPALLAPSTTIPVADGRPLLGIWQSVVPIDSNTDNHEREVRLSFVTG